MLHPACRPGPARTPRHVALLALLLVPLASCAGKADRGSSDDSAPTGCPEGEPCITILTPTNGAVVPTCLDMTVRVDNFDIVSPADHEENVEGEGHWHMEINEEPLLIPCEDLRCQFSIEGLDDGPISVVAVLADNTYVKLTDSEGAYIQDTASYQLVGDGVVCP